MDLVGTVNCSMNKAKWAALIEQWDELDRVDNITVVNPFTQETESVGKPGECVSITIDGANVGSMRWCERGSGVDVHGEAAALRGFIESFTKACSGTFDPLG